MAGTPSHRTPSHPVAARELLEETGYRTGSLRRLGHTHPNPSFIDNRLSTWLATDLEPVDADRRTFGVQ